MAIQTEDVLLTTDEVEKLYKVDKSTQKLYRANGTWSYMKPGRRIYYRKSVLESWVEQNQIINKQDREKA